MLTFNSELSWDVQQTFPLSETVGRTGYKATETFTFLIFSSVTFLESKDCQSEVQYSYGYGMSINLLYRVRSPR